jgi:hypothetical protein
MRWSQSDLCRRACFMVGIDHEQYIAALKYILSAGPARGHMAVQLLAKRMNA